MRTDGIFNLQKITVNAKSGQTTRFIPFGDVHRDSPAHAKEKWQEFKDYAKSVRNEAIFLGMGDYLDSYSTSERAVIYSDVLHDSTRQREEEETIERVKSFASELQFMRGRLIGIMSGNHYPAFRDGTTGDQLLARELGTSFLGVCAAIKIVFVPRKGGTSTSVDVFAHHGKGGGTTATGRFAAVQNLDRVAEADIFLMGDNHARGILSMGDKIRLNENNQGLYVKSRQAFIGRTGAFLKAYEPGVSSYVVDRALPPSNLGWIEFQLTPRRIRNNGIDRVEMEIKALQ